MTLWLGSRNQYVALFNSYLPLFVAEVIKSLELITGLTRIAVFYLVIIEQFQ